MSSTDHYLTFPLALLQFPGRKPHDITATEAADRCKRIVFYAIGEAIELMESHDDTRMVEMAGRAAERITNQDYAAQLDNEESLPFLAACELLGWNPQWLLPDATQLEATSENWKDIGQQVKLEAGKKLSRIRQDVILDTLRGKMPWKEFATLAAIMAACLPIQRYVPPRRGTAAGADDRSKSQGGSAAAVQVHRPQLIAMASGHCSARTVDKSDCMTPAQFDWLRKRLEKRKWFAWGTINRRKTYVSNKLSPDELAKWTGTLKAKSLVRKYGKMTAKEFDAASTAEAHKQLRAMQRNYTGPHDAEFSRALRTTEERQSRRIDAKLKEQEQRQQQLRQLMEATAITPEEAAEVAALKQKIESRQRAELKKNPQ